MVRIIRVLIVWLFGTAGCLCFGQASKTDSLKQLVATTPDDSIRVASEILLSKMYLRTDPDSFYVWCNKALTQSKQYHNANAEAESLLLLGIYSSNAGAYQRALNLFLRSREIFDSLGAIRGVAGATNSIATIYMSQNDYDKALQQLYASEKGALKDEKNMGILLTIIRHNIGICLDETGRREEALEVFMKNAEYQLAHQYLREASSTYNSIGEVYTNLKKYALARTYFQKSLVLKDSLNDMVGKATLFLNMGAMYKDQAIEDSTHFYLDKSLAISKHGGLDELTARALKVYAELYKKLGRPDLAFPWLDQYVHLKDSLNKETQTSTMADLRAVYEKDEADKALKLKDAEARLLDEDNKRKMNVLYGMGIILILMIVFSAALVWANSRRRKSNRELRLITDHTETQNRKLASLGAQLAEQHEKLSHLHQEQENIMNMMAHDLKAPLARSSALLGLITANGPLNDEQMSYIRLIERSHNHGQHLIQSLLSLRYLESGEEKLNLSTGDGDEFIRRLTETYQAKATEKKIELLLEPGSSLGSITTDFSHLERVLDNLISNALKFSKSNTRITVKYDRDATRWWFSVTDQGPGIKPEEKMHLFAKFRKLSARPTGGESSSGLGLAIVKLLVESLKGGITVESEVGKGTSFKVTLPL